MKNLGGRPRKEFNKKDFEALCGIQCTQAEMAAFFGCDEDTLQAWVKRTYNERFSVIFAEKKGKGKISLRRRQWQVAEKGNVPMLIFLGKNILGQTDKQELSTDNDKGFTLNYNINKNENE